MTVPNPIVVDDRPFINVVTTTHLSPSSLSVVLVRVPVVDDLSVHVVDD